MPLCPHSLPLDLRDQQTLLQTSLSSSTLPALTETSLSEDTTAPGVVSTLHRTRLTSENSLWPPPLLGGYHPLPTKAVISCCLGHFPLFSAPGSPAPSTSTQAILHDFNLHTDDSPAPWPLQAPSPLSSPQLPGGPHFPGTPWTWTSTEAAPSPTACLPELLSCFLCLLLGALVLSLLSPSAASKLPGSPSHCHPLLASPLLWHRAAHGPLF